MIVIKIYMELKIMMNINGYILNLFFFFKFYMCKEDMFKIFMDFNDRKLLNDFYLLRIKIIF